MDCPICMEPETNWSGSTTAQCGHSVCMPCFLQHTRTNRDATCPMCRGAYVEHTDTNDDECDCTGTCVCCDCTGTCVCCDCTGTCVCCACEGTCVCCDCDGTCYCGDDRDCDCTSTCYCDDACECDEDYTCESHATAADPVSSHYKTDNRYSYMDVEN